MDYSSGYYVSWVRSERSQAEALIQEPFGSTSITKTLRLYGADPKEYKIEYQGPRSTSTDVLDLREYTTTGCTVSSLSPEQAQNYPGNYFQWLKDPETLQCGANDLYLWRKDDVSQFSVYTHIHHVHTHVHTHTHKKHAHTHNVMYIHTHTHTHKHAYTCMHVHTHAHAHTHIMCTHMYAHTHKHAHTHTMSCTYTHTHKHAYTCMHVHTHAHAHAHMHTCTHAHMHMHILIHTHTLTLTCTHAPSRAHLHAVG